MPEGRTDPVVGQQYRLSAPRTVETAMRHGTCGGFNSAFCLSGPDRQGFLLGRLPTCQDLRSSHHQDISTFIAQQFHCVHLSLTSFPGCLVVGGILKHLVNEISEFRAPENSTKELITLNY